MTESFLNIIKAQIIDFEKQMTVVINNLRQFINYSAKFTMESGFILPVEENFESIIQMSSQLITELKKAGYYDLIRKFSKNNKEFTAVQIQEMAKRFSGAITYYGAIEKTVLSGLQNMQYQGMVVLGQSAVNNIASSLYNSVLTGSTNQQLIIQLEKNLDTMSRHAETYLRTAKREYSQQTEFEIAREAGITDIIWEYIGAPLQDNSHPECIWALTEKIHCPFFTTAEMEEFQAGGGHDHTEPRWNCQHIFGITDMTFGEYKEA